MVGNLPKSHSSPTICPYCHQATESPGSSSWSLPQPLCFLGALPHVCFSNRSSPALGCLPRHTAPLLWKPCHMEDQYFLMPSSRLTVPWDHPSAPSSVPAGGDLWGCDPHPTAPTGARGGAGAQSLCLAELVPFPVSLAGTNKTSPSLGAPAPRPCLCSLPKPHSSCLPHQLPRLPTLSPWLMAVVAPGI